MEKSYQKMYEEGFVGMNQDDIIELFLFNDPEDEKEKSYKNLILAKNEKFLNSVYENYGFCKLKTKPNGEISYRLTKFYYDIRGTGGWKKHIEKIKAKERRQEIMEQSIINTNSTQKWLGFITIIFVVGSFIISYKTLNLTEQANQDNQKTSKQERFLQQQLIKQDLRIDSLKEFLLRMKHEAVPKANDISK